MRSLSHCRRSIRATLLRRDRSFTARLGSLLFQILFIGALLVVLMSCSRPHKDAQSLIADQLRRPDRTAKVAFSDNGVHSLEISILTFNIAALPWPIASGRGDAIAEIGRQVAALSDSGPPIDIILIQEGFLPETTQIQREVGLRFSVSGPGRTFRSSKLRREEEPHDLHTTPGQKRWRKWWKGEGIGSWVGSGLHVFSAYPVIAVKRTAFGKHACAGYDCLANKGAVAAQILLPGLPVPLDIVTAHLNSTRSAGVPIGEADRAHAAQVDHLAGFWMAATNPRHPAILAGDLNIRDSQQRFVPLAKKFSEAEFVKDGCQNIDGPTICHIGVRSDAPWLSSQDVHLYRSGQTVAVEPIEAKTVFNEPVDGVYLSDHAGYLVRYQLSWTPLTVASIDPPDEAH